MFFQLLTSIILIVGFCYAVWRLIIKPILESKGVEIDDEPEVKTDHTKRLDKTRQEHTETTASVEAVREEKQLKADIEDMEQEIKDTDRAIEDGDFEKKE